MQRTFWIDHVPPEAATGLLKRLYESAWGPEGVDHVIQAHSLVPHALEALLVFYKRVMHGPGDLPYLEREMVAVTVSALNRCLY